MKSFNPTSSHSVRSNILPFTPSHRTKLNTTVAQPAAQNSIGQRFWDWLYQALMPTSEPKITQKQGRNGQEYYQVYDPVSGSSKTFSSEMETRIWLDRRFYQ